MRLPQGSNTDLNQKHLRKSDLTIGKIERNQLRHRELQSAA